MEQEIVDHLAHYGIIGQKWGVRKQRGSKGNGKGKGKTDSVKLMTTEELRTANDRLNLEQNYRRLNPSKKDKGKQAAREILSTVGIGVSMYNLAKSPAVKAAIDLGKRSLEK